MSDLQTPASPGVPSARRRAALLAVQALHADAGDGRSEACLSWLALLARMHEASPAARCVKTVGARSLWCFDEAGEAWRCWSVLRDDSVCAALHVGEVLAHECDVFGASVNLLHRMLGLSNAAELVVSEQALLRLDPASRSRAVALGACYLKHWPVAEPCFRLTVR